MRQQSIVCYLLRKTAPFLCQLREKMQAAAFALAVGYSLF